MHYKYQRTLVTKSSKLYYRLQGECVANVSSENWGKLGKQMIHSVVWIIPLSVHYSFPSPSRSLTPPKGHWHPSPHQGKKLYWSSVEPNHILNLFPIIIDANSFSQIVHHYKVLTLISNYSKWKVYSWIVARSHFVEPWAFSWPYSSL